ncbi:MAG: hypothetical protein AB1758_09920 [Candidatus Eremiobacterota bacterium]
MGIFWFFLPAGLSALIAFSAGYSPGTFFLLGVFLGWSGLPFTWLVTREPIRPGEASADYVEWMRYYHSVRLAVLTMLPVLLLIGFYLAVFFSVQVIPVVQIYDGMGMERPAVVQLLTWLTKPFRNPLKIIAIWAACLVLPTLIYLVVTRLPYRFPWFGRIWLHLDRLAALQAMRLATDGWEELLPPEVRRRAGKTPLAQWLSGELGSIEEERAALQAAMWAMVPLLVPVLAVLAVTVGLWFAMLLAPLTEL